MKENKKLKFNFIILDRNIENKFMKFLKKNKYDKYFLFYAKGSANSALLDYLGIGESEKEVIVIPSNESDSLKLFEVIQNSEYIKQIIAFKIPIKGISSKKSLNYFLKEVVKDE